jgi:hypothetical protein
MPRTPHGGLPRNLGRTFKLLIYPGNHVEVCSGYPVVDNVLMATTSTEDRVYGLPESIEGNFVRTLRYGLLLPNEKKKVGSA